VDRLLRREGHPLGVRRAEATAIATAEAEEAATSGRKWTFGVAAGALLMAGTFAAGALGLTSGAAPIASSAPEHAPAAPGHGPQGGAPVVGAPAGQQQQQDPHQQTKPSSAVPVATAPAPRDGSQTGNPGSGGNGGGGGGGNGGGQPAPAPAPAPAPQPAPQQPAPQQPAPPAQQQGPLGSVVTPVVDVVDGVLSPVTDIVGGILSPLSAGPQTTAQSAAPAGPALTMINPLGDLLGG
jgi:hypothetical protein